VHGVFPSNRGKPASSQAIQFRWVMLETAGSRYAVVQVRNTRQGDFATCHGPCRLQPPFTGASGLHPSPAGQARTVCVTLRLARVFLVNSRHPWFVPRPCLRKFRASFS